MKKIICFAAVLGLCVGLLAGCAGSEKPQAATNPPTTATNPEYVPLPEVTEPTKETDAPREFAITIADPGPIPTVDSDKNVTPEEFADILLVENKAPFTSQFMECEPEQFERRHDVYALGVTNISDKTIEKVIVTKECVEGIAEPTVIRTAWQ